MYEISHTYTILARSMKNTAKVHDSPNGRMCLIWMRNEVDDKKEYCNYYYDQFKYPLRPETTFKNKELQCYTVKN